MNTDLFPMSLYGNLLLQHYTSHTQQMIRQRVYQIASGYEDCNDADHLRIDPALRLAIGKDEIFYTLKEAQVLIEEWRMEYNTFRPHSSLKYRPPAPEAWLH